MSVFSFWNGAPSVSTALAQDRNNFAPIRLALALAVVVSHAFSVTTGVITEVFSCATGDRVTAVYDPIGTVEMSFA